MTIKYIREWSVSVTTPATAVKSDTINRRHIIIKAHQDNVGQVYVAIMTEPGALRPKDVTHYDRVYPGETYFYGAPANKRIEFIYAYTSGGTQKIGIKGSDGAIGIPVNQKVLAGRIHLEPEETMNDSDKTFTVPTGRMWKILWIHIEFTTTAVVGVRAITIQILDTANDIIYQRQAVQTQAESIGPRTYLIIPGGPLDTNAGREIIPLPPVVLLPNDYSIRIMDYNVIDAGNDDMIIQMMVEETTLW